MDPVVVAFGTALASAMATDTWQRARTTVGALWRRVRPTQPAETIDGELDTLRQRVLDARQQERADVEQSLAGIWQGRLQELVLDDPTLLAELRQILDEILTPMLIPAERVRIGLITMTGNSRDASTFNQFIGNQHNTRP